MMLNEMRRASDAQRGEGIKQTKHDEIFEIYYVRERDEWLEFDEVILFARSYYEARSNFISKNLEAVKINSNWK